MRQTNTGGPAFPVPDDASDMPGMTLRDYFAAKAMQGMFAADTADSFIPTKAKACNAYEMADAMLEARTK